MFKIKEDDIDIPVDESGNCIDSGVHYTETYLVYNYIPNYRL
jgi:hypothetical protein